MSLGQIRVEPYTTIPPYFTVPLPQAGDILSTLVMKHPAYLQNKALPWESSIAVSLVGEGSYRGVGARNAIYPEDQLPPAWFMGRLPIIKFRRRVSLI